MSPLRIIVTGLIAQHPKLGGVSWDYLQYVVGLARLGHDVYYFEDSGQWPYNLDGGTSGDQWVAHDCKPNVENLAKIMARFGLADKWAYHFPIKSEWFGLPAGQRQDVIRTADMLINVSGTLERPENYRSVSRMAYIDSDPVFTQIKLKLSRGQEKFQENVGVHDVYFSFGEHFSNAELMTDHIWYPTRQPIVLSEWRACQNPRNVFTTVMSWTSYKPLEYDGRKFGQKDMEFRRFLALPQMVGAGLLEIAMSGTRHMNWEGEDQGETANSVSDKGNPPAETLQEFLNGQGWRTVNAYRQCSDLDSYRDYIESSKAEWSVAKNGYVRGQVGWFSCRSACYLAAGRPVVVQDTGFGPVLPVGEGILSFNTVNEAATAIDAVQTSYSRHARAARDIAEEYFDSGRVLTALIDAIAMGSSKGRKTGSGR